MFLKHLYIKFKKNEDFEKKLFNMIISNNH